MGSLRPICVNCGREMSCAKNGIVVYHLLEHATPGPVQQEVGNFVVVDTDRLFEGSWKEGDIDFVALGDRYQCKKCGFSVVVGCSELMMATTLSGFTQEDLKRIVEEAEEKVEISSKN